MDKKPSRLLVVVLHLVEELRFRYAVSPATLRTMALRLLESGWTFTTLAALPTALHSTKTVVLTFDDAYRSVWSNALPVLRELDISAVCFVPTAVVGRDNGWNRRAPLRTRHCTWRQLGSLVDAGWEIGSHTHRHFNLQALSLDAIHEEIELADCRLKQNLGIRPVAVAYPFGKFDDRVVGAIEDRFQTAVTTERGGDLWPRDRLRLRRVWPALLDKEILESTGVRERR